MKEFPFITLQTKTCKKCGNTFPVHYTFEQNYYFLSVYKEFPSLFWALASVSPYANHWNHWGLANVKCSILHL